MNNDSPKIGSLIRTKKSFWGFRQNPGDTAILIPENMIGIITSLFQSEKVVGTENIIYRYCSVLFWFKREMEIYTILSPMLKDTENFSILKDIEMINDETL